MVLWIDVGGGGGDRLMNQMLIAILDVEAIAVFWSPVIVLMPDVAFPHESLRKVDPVSMCDIASRQIVWEDVGRRRVKERGGFEEGDVVSWNFLCFDEVINDV